MKKIKEFFASRKAGWITTVISILGLAYVLIAGGTTEQTFTGKDGSVYTLKENIPIGIMDLIDKCDLKVEGQTCPVSGTWDLTLKTKGTKAVDPAAPATPATNVVIPVTPVEPLKVDPIKSLDIKPMEAGKDTETKPLPDKVPASTDVLIK